MNSPLQILERYWGYSEFRPKQLEIIQTVLEQQDCIGLLPTGGGKSICFQIPALINEGICIVISPLIALMQDQVKSLDQKGIKALALTNLSHSEDLERLLDNCIYGNYKFLYLSPERLQNKLVQERIKLMNVSLIVVDEAHCISQWGHDFRPAYRSIHILHSLCPQASTIALSATATKQVLKDIEEQLELKKPKLFKSSFFRENLTYKTYQTEDKNYKIKTLLEKSRGSALIYVGSRLATQQLAKTLSANGFSCGFYHGGMSNKEKEQQYKQWMNNENKVMVATNAFGMGIDKSDVSTVIHTHISESLEHYFQEAGRGGRNQKSAQSVLLIGPNDVQSTKNWYINQIPDVDFLKHLYKKLCTYFQIAYGELSEEKHGFNFNSFCSLYELPKRKTYNGLKVLDRHGLIVFEEYLKKKTSIIFLVTHKVLMKTLEHDNLLQLIVTTILRTYEGIHHQETTIDIQKIAKILQQEPSEIIHHLKLLNEKEIVKFKNFNTDAQITFTQPREDEKSINRISKILKIQNKIKRQKVQAMIEFIENNTICKSQQLLAYFGETQSKVCGNCTVCLKNNTPDQNHFKKENVDLILKSLQVHPLSSRDLAANLSLSADEVITLLKHLLEEEKIEYTETNEYQLKCR